MKFMFLIVAGGILIYIFVDCSITLNDNSIGTSTTLKTTLEGLSLSICLSQRTSMYNDNSKDVANTIDFWMEGNNLSRKIDELSVKSTNGDWINIWNRNTGSVTIPLQQQIFQSVNVIKNDVAVDFCHTVDLSQR